MTETPEREPVSWDQLNPFVREKLEYTAAAKLLRQLERGPTAWDFIPEDDDDD
jgi:hypothetical protein